jgi:hypothetical protein
VEETMAPILLIVQLQVKRNNEHEGMFGSVFVVIF